MASSASTSSGPNYALYRASGLGRAFVESIGEMYTEGEMSNDQVIQALLTFDASFNQQLAQKHPQNKITLEGHLSNYRYCDGVWTLNLSPGQIHGLEGTIAPQHIKIVACEAKAKPKVKATAAAKK